MKTWNRMILGLALSTAAVADESHRPQPESAITNNEPSPQACKEPVKLTEPLSAALELARRTQMDLLIYAKINVPQLYDRYLGAARTLNNVSWLPISGISSAMVGLPLAVVGYSSVLLDDTVSGYTGSQASFAGSASFVAGFAVAQSANPIAENAREKKTLVVDDIQVSMREVETALSDFLGVKDAEHRGLIQKALQKEGARIVESLQNGIRPDPVNLSHLFSKYGFLDHERLHALQASASDLLDQSKVDQPVCEAPSFEEILSRYDAWENDLKLEKDTGASGRRIERARLLARIARERRRIEALRD